jgi:hypothetical protein
MQKDYRALVTLACLIGATLSGALLYFGITATGPASSEPVVGSLAQSELSVRRKSHRSYHWEELQSGRTLHQKDVIRTGDGAYATLELNSGKTLDLGPNSSVVLSESEETVLESLRGQAIIRGARGDQKISTTPDGKKKIETLSARLLSPALRATFFADTRLSASVELKWRLDQKESEKKTKVQISSSRSFPRDQLLQTEVSSDQFEWSVKLAPGTYFWRLTRDEQPLSEVRSFQVYPAVVMRPISPSPSQPIQFWGETGGGRFLWKNPFQDSLDHARNTALIVQVSEDQSFALPVVETKVQGNADQVRIEGLTPGRYFWRVLAQYGDQESASPHEDFDVTQLNAPALSLSYPPSEASFAQVEPVRMSWSSEPSLSRYGITIEKVDEQTQNSTPVLSLDSLLSPQFRWTSVSRGVFRWKVDGYADSRKVGESDWRYFSLGSLLRIIAEQPGVESQVYFTPRSAGLQFRWSDPRGSDGGLRFRIQIAEDSEFTRIIKTHETLEARWTPLDWRPNAGTYYWRVLAFDQTQAVAGRSAGARFSYRELPPPLTPVAISPTQSQAINLSTKAGVVRFEWKPVLGAKSYRVTLKQGSQVIHESPEISAAHWEFVRPPLGALSWSVVAIDEYGRSSAYAPYQSIQIKAGKVLSAPRAISSEVQ